VCARKTRGLNAAIAAVNVFGGVRGHGRLVDGFPDLALWVEDVAARRTGVSELGRDAAPSPTWDHSSRTLWQPATRGWVRTARS